MVLISTAAAPSSWAKSCRKLISETCRFPSICARVAALTWTLQRYCNTARPTNTAASAGTATHRRRRSLVCGLVISIRCYGRLRGELPGHLVIHYRFRLPLKVDRKPGGPQWPLQQGAELSQKLWFVDHSVGAASGTRRAKLSAG